MTPEQARSRLTQKAKATVTANIVATTAGPMIAAGGGHFRSLWVRDFCYSVPGLLVSGHEALVKNQLLQLFKFRKDGWLPRGLDVVAPQMRVTWNLFISRDPWFMKYEGRKLVGEYLGEHKTPAYDSNLLFILAAEAYEQHTKETLFTREQLKELLSVFVVDQNGLLNQPAFSDWQDSARREGPILLTHLLYLKAGRFLERTDIVERTVKAIETHFYDSQLGMFRERPGQGQISLDSHIVILTSGLSFRNVDPTELYIKLKNSTLWKQKLTPGVPIAPRYPATEISWTQKLIGLRQYHDGFVWGWLTAEAFKCARLCKDESEANRILTVFVASTEKDPFVAEIYDPETLARHNAFIYKSEMPFTWSAAKWLEALSK